MARPSQIDQQRKDLLPVVCRAFSEMGYRRTTTAELARRCKVRENILYRLWPDKKRMFLAAIDDLFQRRVERWDEFVAEEPSAQEAAAHLVAYEAKHMGEFGFYRVVFTALAEADDPDIRLALVRMYRRFHKIMSDRIEASQERDKRRPGLPADLTSWALIGLATISNIIRELELLKPKRREEMFATVAKSLLNLK